MTGPHLLEVKDLTVDFLSLGGAFRATSGVSFMSTPARRS